LYEIVYMKHRKYVIIFLLASIQISYSTAKTVQNMPQTSEDDLDLSP